jgi:ATP-dependent DNA helicase RecG
MTENPLIQKIEFIKGVGPNKALVLNKELGIRVLQDMLGFFPFRYEDRSEIKKLSEINDDTNSALYEVQVVSKKKWENIKENL